MSRDVTVEPLVTMYYPPDYLTLLALTTGGAGLSAPDRAPPLTSLSQLGPQAAVAALLS